MLTGSLVEVNRGFRPQKTAARNNMGNRTFDTVSAIL
jgi:hypothetical protein